MKFVIKKSKNDKFYFILKARNGEVVAVSEMYESKQGCKKGVRAVKKMIFAPVVDETINTEANIPEKGVKMEDL